MRSAALATLFLASILAPRVARADDPAQTAFDEGQTLMKAGRYEDACAKFRESESLSPSGGAALNLGECNDKSGKPADAYAFFEKAIQVAHAAGKPDIEAYAQGRLNDVKARVTLVTIDASLVPLEVVSFDSVPLPINEWGRGHAVMPGDHNLAAHAPDHAPFQLTVHLVAGETRSLHVPALEAGVDPSMHVSPPGPPDGATRDAQWIAGIVVGSVGVASAIAGSAVGGAAIAKNNEALPHCHAQRCDPTGLDLTKATLRLAYASDALLIGGGVLAGVGVVVFATAPRASKSSTSSPRSGSVNVRATAAIGAAGVTVDGTF